MSKCTVEKLYLKKEICSMHNYKLYKLYIESFNTYSTCQSHMEWIETSIATRKVAYNTIVKWIIDSNL